MARDCTRPGGCAACSRDLDPSCEPRKHCDKLIYRSGFTFWISISLLATVTLTLQLKRLQIAAAVASQEIMSTPWKVKLLGS